MDAGGIRVEPLAEAIIIIIVGFSGTYVDAFAPVVAQLAGK